MCDVCLCLDQVGECQVSVQLRPSQQRQENLPASQTPARSVLLTLPVPEDSGFMFLSAYVQTDRPRNIH
jgi:hypothetical protein